MLLDMDAMQHLADLGLSYSQILIVAGEADADPRTVLVQIDALRGRGRPVRGRVGERIRRALRARGLAAPEIDLGEHAIRIEAK